MLWIKWYGSHFLTLSTPIKQLFSIFECILTERFVFSKPILKTVILDYLFIKEVQVPYLDYTRLSYTCIIDTICYLNLIHISIYSNTFFFRAYNRRRMRLTKKPCSGLAWYCLFKLIIVIVIPTIAVTVTLTKLYRDKESTNNSTATDEAIQGWVQLLNIY